MRKRYYLPIWMHRIFNGLFGAALFAGFASVWSGEPSGTWRSVVSQSLLWLSIPVGIILAAIAHRFSIVEGVAGEIGYEERDETNKADENQPR